MENDDYLEVIKIGKRSILCLDQVKVYDKNVCVTGFIKNIELSGIGDTAQLAAEDVVQTVRNFLATLEEAVEKRFGKNESVKTEVRHLNNLNEGASEEGGR